MSWLLKGRMSWAGKLRFHARKLQLLEAQRSQLRLAVELRQKLPSLERESSDPGMARGKRLQGLNFRQERTQFFGECKAAKKCG